MSDVTWRKLIEEALRDAGDKWEDVVGHTFIGDSLDVKFHNGFGGSEGCPFTLWTAERVYFPVVYDGAEWVGSAPRNPCGEAMGHMGGE